MRSVLATAAATPGPVRTIERHDHLGVVATEAASAAAAVRGVLQLLLLLLLVATAD